MTLSRQDLWQSTHRCLLVTLFFPVGGSYLASAYSSSLLLSLAFVFQRGDKRIGSSESNPLFFSSSYLLRSPRQRLNRTVDVVRVEDAVQVVAFVLEDDRRESLDALRGVLQCPWRGVKDVNVPITGDIASPVGNAEAALRADFLFTAQRAYPDVGVDLEREALLVKSLHCDNAPGNAYLRSRNADAILLRGGHRRYHFMREEEILFALQFFPGDVPALCPEHQRIIPVRDSQDPHRLSAAADDGLFVR